MKRKKKTGGSNAKCLVSRFLRIWIIYTLLNGEKICSREVQSEEEMYYRDSIRQKLSELRL